MTKNFEAELNKEMGYLEVEGFVTIESDNGFMQACKNSNGGYIIEYQDSSQNHYKAKKEDFTLQDIKEFFRLYLSDSKNGQWKHDAEWGFLENFTVEPSPLSLVVHSWLQKIKNFFR